MSSARIAEDKVRLTTLPNSMPKGVRASAMNFAIWTRLTTNDTAEKLMLAHSQLCITVRANRNQVDGEKEERGSTYTNSTIGIPPFPCSSLKLLTVLKSRFEKIPMSVSRMGICTIQHGRRILFRHLERSNNACSLCVPIMIVCNYDGHHLNLEYDISSRTACSFAKIVLNLSI